MNCFHPFKIALISLLVWSSFSSLKAQQLISYEVLDTFTTADINGLMDDLGLPAGIVVPEYDVVYCKVLYNTAYKTLDNQVQASGGMAIPLIDDCPLPLVSYQHGTQAKVNNVSSNMNGGQWEVTILYASVGYMVGSPDYLGLGDPDPEVIVHPYMHHWSQAHTTINMLRAGREIAEAEGIALNDQIFFFGYSQGGSASVAAQKYIEEFYSDEFQVTANAPMSGAYDLKVAQVELIASDEVYPTPGYLPYIIIGYESIYDVLYDDPSEMFVAPYDSLMPALFYGGEHSIGAINGMSEPIPKHMIQDSVVEAFISDTLHPFRQLLAESHLLEWAPQAPVKLHYCSGDEQVTYLNSENAYDQWTANGAPNVEKANFGPFTHNDCALFCFVAARDYFDSFKLNCDGTPPGNPVGIAIDEQLSQRLFAFPNPGSDLVRIGIAHQDYTVVVYDLLGKKVLNQNNDNDLDVSDLSNGTYFFQVSDKQNGAFLGSGSFVVTH